MTSTVRHPTPSPLPVAPSLAHPRPQPQPQPELKSSFASASAFACSARSSTRAASPHWSSRCLLRALAAALRLRLRLRKQCTLQGYQLNISYRYNRCGARALFAWPFSRLLTRAQPNGFGSRVLLPLLALALALPLLCSPPLSVRRTQLQADSRRSDRVHLEPSILTAPRLASPRLASPLGS